MAAGADEQSLLIIAVRLCLEETPCAGLKCSGRRILTSKDDFFAVRRACDIRIDVCGNQLRRSPEQWRAKQLPFDRAGQQPPIKYVAAIWRKRRSDKLLTRWR